MRNEALLLLVTISMAIGPRNKEVLIAPVPKQSTARPSPQSHNPLSLRTEHLPCQLVRVVALAQDTQHRHEKAVGVGGGHALQVQGVRQDGSQQNPRDGLRQLPGHIRDARSQLKEE